MRFEVEVIKEYTVYILNIGKVFILRLRTTRGTNVR